MPNTDFATLLSGMSPEDAGFTVTLASDWLQGRTAYGGLSAALCFEATQRVAGDLPPLRSAQFAFVGPAVGTLRIEPTLLRRGKSSAFFGTDLHGEAGLAVRGLLCFGANRQSSLNMADFPVPDVPGWDESPVFFKPSKEISFISHFDGRFAAGGRPRTPGVKPEMIVWLRHVDTQATDGMAALIALADALPPAAMVMFPPEPAPISTMTWSIDILSDQPRSETGWFLVRSTAQTAAGGYSAQDMAVWNDKGEPVMAMRQTVAIFT